MNVKEGVVSVVRILVDLERTCYQAAMYSKLLRDRERARATAEALRLTVDLLKVSTGVEYQMYDDEIDLAVYQAVSDGITLKGWDNV